MTDCPRCRATCLVVLAAIAAGCNPTVSRLSLVSYQDPYFPEHYSLRPVQCAYYVDRGGDQHILARAESPMSAGTVDQLLHVHVFWRPRPGKTRDDPSTVDAVLRYALVTNEGAALYCGTGFVYPRRNRLDGSLDVLIESARLRLEHVRGQASDVLGETRVSGSLRALPDPAAAVDLLRTFEIAAASATP